MSLRNAGRSSAPPSCIGVAIATRLPVSIYLRQENSAFYPNGVAHARSANHPRIRPQDAVQRSLGRRMDCPAPVATRARTPTAASRCTTPWRPGNCRVNPCSNATTVNGPATAASGKCEEFAGDRNRKSGIRRSPIRLVASRERVIEQRAIVRERGEHRARSSADTDSERPRSHRSARQRAATRRFRDRFPGSRCAARRQARRGPPDCDPLRARRSLAPRSTARDGPGHTRRRARARAGRNEMARSGRSTARGVAVE